jgi:hypothetical protein
MRRFPLGALAGCFLLLLFTLTLGAGQKAGPGAGSPELARLVSTPTGWRSSEPTRFFLPDTLFEYIDGAAESFLGYDFRELAVAQYAREGSACSLTVEIYDMGGPRNAFGIYGAERYPDSHFISIGTQGYYEEGSLNFFAGRYYVKLMGYDCGADAESQLTAIASGIAAGIAGPAGFPPVLSDFPKAGLVANSEKFVRHNYQGLSFLDDGYQASYAVDGREFECFIVECPDGARAEAVTARYLDHFRQAGLEVAASGPGYTFNDKYLHHVFVARAGRFLCGVSRVPDGSEELGRSYLGELVKALGSGSPAAAGQGR